MFGIGAGELLVLLLVALLVLGPERMPKLARDVGRAMGDLRRTSDELRDEFLSADRLVDAAARRAERSEPTGPATAADVGSAGGDPMPSAQIAALPEAAGAEAATAAPQPAEAAEPGLTQAAVDPDETELDREARAARERLDDPERRARAQAEGWTAPTDEAGTSDRWA
jgi:sec-independent protein translocase protein TatB